MKQFSVVNCFIFFQLFQTCVFFTPEMSREIPSECWLKKTQDGTYQHIGHENFTERGPNGGKTLHHMFVQAVKFYPDADFLGTINIEENNVEYISYLQTFNKIVKMADFLKNEINIVRKSIVGILSKNKEEWFVSEQSILRIDSISCPLYGAYGTEALAFILQQTEMENIFLESDKARLLYDALVNSDNIFLKRLIFFDKKILDENQKFQQQKENMNHISYEDAEKLKYLDGLLENPDLEVLFYQDILNDSSLEDLTKEQIQKHPLSSDPSYQIPSHSHLNSQAENIKKILKSLKKPKRSQYQTLSDDECEKLLENPDCNNNPDLESLQEPKNESNQKDKDFTMPRFDIETNTGSNTINDELDDVITICYTSGTSGLPKGVLLTDSNFIGLISGFSNGNKGKPILDFGKEFVYISYLPLAHSMEKICFYIVISIGGKIGFSIDPRNRLVQDIELIKPKLLPGVPAIFDKIKEGITAEISKKNRIIQWIFWNYLKFKIRRQKESLVSKYNSVCLDYLIFGKIKKKFGNDLRFALCGSAPLSERTNDFISAVFSFRIYQGYGQTEALAANTLQTPFSTFRSSVGIPFPSILIKLVDTDYAGKKEICLKGQAVTKGYFKNEKETKETIKDGWLHTGDIGEFINDELYITGRLKDTFKLKNGEFIAPEKIESLYSFNDIQHVLIARTPNHDHIFLIAFTENHNLDINKLKSQFDSRTKTLLKEKKITNHTRPIFIITIFMEKSFEDLELTTPTNKKKRFNILDHYQIEISEKVEIEMNEFESKKSPRLSPEI